MLVFGRGQLFCAVNTIVMCSVMFVCEYQKSPRQISGGFLTLRLSEVGLVARIVQHSEQYQQLYNPSGYVVHDITRAGADHTDHQ